MLDWIVHLAEMLEKKLAPWAVGERKIRQTVAAWTSRLRQGRSRRSAWSWCCLCQRVVRRKKCRASLQLVQGNPYETMSQEIHSQYDSILILDFGSQYSHLITRRCRELNVYCEMLPCTQKIADLTWKPKGIILSGSPYSVYDDVAPRVDPAVFNYGVPVLGICYGLQEMAWNHGGRVDAHDTR